MDDLEHCSYTSFEDDLSYTESLESVDKEHGFGDCGTRRHAIITFFLGLIFFPFWVSGCYGCCHGEENMDSHGTYIIYIVQLFFLLIIFTFGFVFLASYLSTQELLFLQNCSLCW